MKTKNFFLIKGFTESAVFTVISRVSGFIRDIFIAAFLGAGINTDIFLIAFKLPNLFRRITAEGALTASILPIYSNLKSQKDKFLANNFLKSLILKVGIILFLIMILFQIIMPFIVYFLAPGFSDDSFATDQIIFMCRITIIFMPLISFVALLGVATNVSGRFWALSFTPIILNFCLIVGCFFISDDLIVKSIPLAIATVLGGMFQLVFMILVVKKFNLLKMEKTSPKETILMDQKKIKFHQNKTWKNFLPAALGGGILQINFLVDTILASIVGFGSVSFLYFADRIAQLPLGIIGVALGSVLLTSLSKSSSNKDAKQFSSELITSFKIGLFFSIPACVVFFNFSDLFVQVLFERGAFSTFETKQTSSALIAYSTGIPAFILLKSCQPAFFAEGNTKTPLYISIILLILNIILSIILMQFLNHVGIALATSISSWVGVMIYIYLLIKGDKILKKNFHLYELNRNSLISYSIRIIFVSIIMLIIMKLFWYFLFFYKINEILILVLLFVVGLSTYILTSFIFGYIPQNLINFYVSKLKKAK